MSSKPLMPRVAAGSVAFVLLAITAAFAFSRLSQSQAKAPPPPPSAEVTVAQVIQRPLREWEEFTGRLQAVNTVELRPRVSGFVDRVEFTDGARVKRGQLLFQIDPRPFRDEVERLRAERGRAVSDLELAKANRARAGRLIAAHAVSQEEFERLVAAESAAQSALGSVTASLQEAQLNLEFTEVRAPIDGHVSRALITPGNLVTSASLLTTLVSDDPVYVYFDADEQSFLRYAKDQRGDQSESAANPGNVFIGLADEQGYPHAARLDFVDNQVDPATGTIRLRAALPNPEGRYTPGLFARVRLVGGEARNGLLIEDRAVGTDLSKKFVLALSADNRIEYRLVELGPEISGLRVIKEGLRPEDVIVINGLQHVRPGQTVAPTKVQMTANADALAQIGSSDTRAALLTAAARQR
jgi:membrane fusion protein, multidrug efflux system